MFVAHIQFSNATTTANGFKNFDLIWFDFVACVLSVCFFVLSSSSKLHRINIRFYHVVVLFRLMNTIQLFWVMNRYVRVSVMPWDRLKFSTNNQENLADLFLNTMCLLFSTSFLAHSNHEPITFMLRACILMRSLHGTKKERNNLWKCCHNQTTERLLPIYQF